MKKSHIKDELVSPCADDMVCAEGITNTLGIQYLGIN
jgi:hypothetical protein